VTSWWTAGTGAASIAGVLALPTTVVVGRTTIVAVLLFLVLVVAIAVSEAQEVRDSAIASRPKARLLAWHFRERQALFVFERHPELQPGCVVELIRHDAELEISFGLV
jgi:hypothetical protein